MNKRDRTAAVAGDDFSPISCLQDEVVLEILKKVMDLKTLCVCQVVSKRFHAIVHQVDTICHSTTWLSNSVICGGLLKSMSKFKRTKSVCIQIPSNYNNNNDDDGRCYLFKWKVKMGFGRIDSFVFVSPASIYDKNNDDGLVLLHEEKQRVELPSKFSIALGCFFDVHLRAIMLRRIATVNNIPLLEKVSITDSDNRGRVSLDGREKVNELRNYWKRCNSLPRKSWCYVSLLELPVSGYVMKGVTLVLAENNDVPDDGNFDRFVNDEIDFKHDDKEEAAYHEAMMEIFKKHKGSIVRK